MIGPYHRLLSDEVEGDPLLFARQDEAEAAWSIVDPVLRDPAPVCGYDPGSWESSQADAMAAPSGGWAARRPSAQAEGCAEGRSSGAARTTMG